MLDVMRKHSRSFIIYILFGIIIAVFVVSFGPRSDVGSCAGKTSAAGSVQGTTITPKTLNYIFSASGIRTQQVSEAQLVMMKGRVIDQLILRELLADDALDMGLRVPDQLVDDMILKGRFLALGQPHPLIRDDNGRFDYDLFSRYVRFSWGLTVKTFKEQQERELLAEKFRDLFRSSITVSEEEARTDFSQRNTQVQLSYVRFTPADFRGQVALSEAQLKAFAAANREKVKKYYEENRTAFQKRPKEVRLQVIRFGTAQPAARKQAQAALARLQKGEDFAKVAQALSTDMESRAGGGVLSWRNEDSPGLGAEATKAVAKLKDGELSPLLEDSKEGVMIVKLLGRRQGDLTLQQAEAQIAEELLRTEEAVKLAKTTAEGFIKRAQAGEKLTALFKVKKEDGSGEPPQSQPASQPAEQPQAGGPRFELTSTASFSPSGRFLIPGLGISKELMLDAFKLKKDEIASRPYVVDENVYLIAVKERTNPDWKDWEKRKSELIEEYHNRKYAQELVAYLHGRCQAALKSKRITVRPEALVTPGYVHPKGEPPLPTYAPCSSFELDQL